MNKTTLAVWSLLVWNLFDIGFHIYIGRVEAFHFTSNVVMILAVLLAIRGLPRKMPNIAVHLGSLVYLVLNGIFVTLIATPAPFLLLFVLMNTVLSILVARALRL